jgi:ABC-2 type transport system permease protein
MLGQWTTNLANFELFRVRLRQLSALVGADMRKLRHDPYDIVIRMLQPSMWLIIFGQAMDRGNMIPSDGLSYIDFIAPGVLAQSMLFVSIFFGLGLLWERDAGIWHKIFVSPAPRYILVASRAIAGGVRCLAQCVLIYALSWPLNIHVRLDPLPMLGAAATVFLGGAIFSTFSMIVATLVKRRERFMGIGQMMGMPLFFASNALYPISMMPHWLQVVSLANPLTYLVQALRGFMITGTVSNQNLSLDFILAIGILCALIALAAKLCPRIIN